MILPQTLLIGQILERSGLVEDDLFENGVNGSLKFVVVVPELGACRVSRDAMSHFLAGADSYPGDKLPEVYSAALSGPWTVSKSRLRILADSWRDWEAHFLGTGQLIDEAANEEARQAVLRAAQRTLVDYERLRPVSDDFRGGRVADTDLLSLREAASMASRHAGVEVSAGDILRAAARGEILLRAVVHRRGKVFKAGGGACINAGHPADENAIPAGSIPTLPLVACEHLANAGHATWRTFDGIKIDEGGEAWRYVKYQLEPFEPGFETVPEDCRVTGYDVHALADAFADDEPGPSTEDSRSSELAIESYPTDILATRQQLVESFGRFVGMDLTWFKALKDIPALEAARKNKGRGGRASRAMEPLFCPFEVMAFVMKKGKKVQRPLSQEKAWTLLEQHFPKVYTIRQFGDPRSPD